MPFTPPENPPRRRAHRLSIFMLAAAPLFAALAGCDPRSPNASAAQKPSAAPTVPVRAAVVESADFPVNVDAIGWVEPLSIVQVKPQVDGQIEKLHFEEGQFVKAGDILATIDPRQYEAAVRLAEANLARDEALALDAQREYDRVRDMHHDGQASNQERDTTEALAHSRAAQVKADQAELDQMRLRLEYCTIRAPMDSRTGARLVHLGAIVKENETPIVVLNQIAPINVAFSVAEGRLPEILTESKSGPLAATVAIGGAPLPEVGRVSFIDNEVDRTTGQVRLKARFDNHTQSLWPGQFVTTTLTTRTLRGALLLPVTAVQNGQSGQYVFVIQSDDSVEMHPVTTGPAAGSRIVIAAGVKLGERVVIDGQLRLAPGAKVRVTAPDSQPASAPTSAESPR